MNSRHSVYYGRQRDVRVHPEEARMFRAEEYQWAILWKNQIASWLGEGHDVEEIADCIEQVRRIDKQKRFLPYAMGYAALSQYSVDAGTGQFWIPSTASVLRAYRSVKRKLSKGKPVTMWMWDDGYSWQERIA